MKAGESEILHIDLEGEKYAIHLKNTSFFDDYINFEGGVYKLCEWWAADDESVTGFSYTNKNDGSTLDEFGEDADCLFEFTFCPRGVWDGRIYPNAGEYYGEQIKEMYEVWQVIEETLKDKIKAANPDKDYSNY